MLVFIGEWYSLVVLDNRVLMENRFALRIMLVFGVGLYLRMSLGQRRNLVFHIEQYHYLMKHSGIDDC